MHHRAAIETVWRQEAAKVIAGVARLVRDVGLAEDYAQDALVAALEHWPRTGVPDNPGAWLMTTAKHRALDRLRQDALHARKHEALAHDMDALQTGVEPDFVDALDAARQDDIGDDLLRLIFIACHPVLSRDARVALTLRLLCGLATDEIARAFLVPEPTIAQRIVRAKRSLSKAGVPFEVPPAHLRAERLGSVLEVIYLVFNEGYAATAGDDWMRPALCREAIRLGRLLAGLAPEESEVQGLLALMELQASRLPARVDEQGAPVLLADQDRGRWDAELVRSGLASLARAEALVARAAASAGEDGHRGEDGQGGQGGQGGEGALDALEGPLGPYALQAALAACHARAATAADTDWPRMVSLYDALMHCAPSPVVALNRAVAVGMAQGPAAALPLVEALDGDPALRGYPWLPSVRGDLLARLGHRDQARAAFEQAAAMTRNARDRDMLLARARALGEDTGD
ncbi:RNA polymerase subunit sigma-24 [Bordetella genomosp. 8]|uniref:RNA polymerase subunit sigma-24 n=1 Tax=Bordetella genomosp. 8 TaxID=1416806 RepID=A0A1W6YQN6_9BORD|nr:RNA polymerase sigma factor [Bordetella genomosp. 8]ARP83416.1 RNA polymerase subunit sigma-24 [Bordetella genomosp. 8]